MYRDVKPKDVIPGRIYWIKTDKRGKWRLTQYVLHDYPDGTSSYFFDFKDWVRIFDFDTIERIVEVNEPDDAPKVS